MVNQNYMVDFMSRLQSMQGEIKKAEPVKDNKLQFPQFKEILSSSMDKPSTRQVQSRNEVVKDNSRDMERNDRVKFKSFKEAEEYTKKADSVQKEKAVDSSGKLEKNDVDEVEDRVKKPVKPKEEAVLESLAQVLGLNKNDLLTLLGALNITTQDLTDPSKTSEIVDKLSGIMGLDNDQKSTLANILGTVSQKVEEQYGKLQAEDIKPEQEEPLSESKKTSEKSAEIEVVKDPKGEFQELMVKFKARLDEIRNSMNKDPQALAKEVVQNLEAMLQENATENSSAEALNADTSKKQFAVEDSKSSVGQAEDTDNKEVQKVHQDSKSDNQADTSSKEQSNNRSIEKTAPQPETVAANESGDSEASQFNNIIAAHTSKNNAAVEAVKTQKEMPITKNELVNQVVEKAKVVINGDKSEMVMELKPESLGKLSLKVVTERGMVVAHFVAESQQVKQVLEANMQLLKDTLEKQGLAVQGFSVSVGQDSQREFTKGEWTHNNPKSNNLKVNSTGGIGINTSNAFQEEKRINPYNWSDSSINLTA